MLKKGNVKLKWEKTFILLLIGFQDSVSLHDSSDELYKLNRQNMINK